MRTRLLLVVFSLIVGFTTFAQNSGKQYEATVIESYWDTIDVKSEGASLSHYYKVSKEVLYNKLHSQYKDEIFTDSFNDFSCLKFDGRFSTFDVPTVPLTHLFILEDKKVIVGLSKYTSTPYNMVLYSFKGDLLYKGRIYFIELKLNKEQIKSWIIKYPEFKYCLEQKPNVLKQGADYYIEVTKCIEQALGDTHSLIGTGQTSHNSFFKNVIVGTHSSYFNRRYVYQQYKKCFNVSDPLYDLIMVGNVPYVLVLNGIDGEKVNIPLVPNCDILKEIED